MKHASNYAVQCADITETAFLTTENHRLNKSTASVKTRCSEATSKASGDCEDVKNLTLINTKIPQPAVTHCTKKPKMYKPLTFDTFPTMT